MPFHRLYHYLITKTFKSMNKCELHFEQGTSDYFKNNRIKEEDYKTAVEAKFAEFFNMKNVCFLFGSGTSCPAIPNMKDLLSKVDVAVKGTDTEKLYNRVKKKAKDNLEEILGVLYSGKFYAEGLLGKVRKNRFKCVKLIKRIEEVIFKEINIDFSTKIQKEVLETYQRFYQKVALRNKDLSRISVFTTNNDLYNETALDSLNIHYVDGFGGGLHKYFNPSLFNYTYSKRMDFNVDKYEPVENMVYLYKIHGSVNWIYDENSKNSFFNIMEVNKLDGYDTEKGVIIYPTPTKQNKSLGAPYVDLFREFQHKLLEHNTVLFVIGYSFSDQHVNDIIYRALATNTTINVVVINDIPSDKEICRIDDKRIFKLWGYENPLDKDNRGEMHFFSYIVNNWLPNVNAFTQDEEITKGFINKFNDLQQQKIEAVF